MSINVTTKMHILSRTHSEVGSETIKMNLIALKEYYKNSLKTFLHKSAIHGLEIFILQTKSRFGRPLWSIFMACIVIWTHFIIISLTIDYLQQPTEIHMSPNLVHVSNSPFPGVAVCSPNKISKSKLLEYAELVFEAQQNFSPNLLAKDVPEMAEKLVVFVNFFVYPFDELLLDQESLTKLHNILSYMYDTVEYRLRDLLRLLAPDCDRFIIRTAVFGTPVPVAKIFSKRLTSTGGCCMFNYFRPSYASNMTMKENDLKLRRNAPVVSFESNSILNSVQVVLRNNKEDYTSKEFNNDAFHIYLFPTDDYATLQSTTNGQVLVDSNTMVDISVQPRFFESSKGVRQFSPKIRQCYFIEEGKKLLNISYYSINECLLYCRLESMLKYCGCVAAPMVAVNRSVTYCTIIDMPCLMEWKSVWYNWDFFYYVENKDVQNTEKSLDANSRCPTCLPVCDGVDFEIFTDKFPLRKPNNVTYKEGILKNLTGEKPLSIIRLFFKQRFARSTEMNIVGDWVVLLNRFGGIMSLMYGFSIISYIEILYYLTGRFLFDIWRLMKAKTHANFSSLPHFKKTARGIKKIHSGSQYIDKESTFNIYWKELIPKDSKYNNQANSVK